MRPGDGATRLGLLDHDRRRRGAAVPPTRPVPSWGLVLATTIRLWAARRLHRLRRSRRALLIAICVLVVGAAAVVVRLTGTSSRATRVSASGGGQQRPTAVSGSTSSSAPSVRSQAAAWIAGQVGSDETIACDPSHVHRAGRARRRVDPPAIAAAGGVRRARRRCHRRVAVGPRLARARTRRRCWPASGPAPA